MPHEKGHGNKAWYDKMQKETTAGKAAKKLQDMYNKNKKKKKKKIGLFDRLKEMGRNI